MEEVGKEFNVTRERIRQIEAKALRKLRNPVRSKRIRDFPVGYNECRKPSNASLRVLDMHGTNKRLRQQAVERSSA